MRLRRRLRALLGLTLLAAAACTHMPLTSMVRLARVDFANTDPAQLRAAVKVPRSVSIRPNGVILRIGVKLKSGHEEFQDFILREVTAPEDVIALQGELEPGTHLFAYRLDPAEAARVAAFRDGLEKKQESAGRKGGSLTIALRPDACRSGALADRPLYATTYLRTMETGGYIPLTRAIDLRTLTPGRDLAEALPLCS